MMREIKFRQPRIANGKFVEWHYWGYVGNKRSFVGPLPPNTGGGSLKYTGITIQPQHRIIPLWEDDICRAEYVCAACCDNNPHILIGIIAQAHTGQWMFDHESGAISIESEDLTIIEVLGNFQQNPELLEKQ